MTAQIRDKKYWQEVYQRAKAKHADRPTAKSKVCVFCKIEKGANAFSKDGRYKDGLQSYCKSCQSSEGFKRPSKHPARKYGLTIEEYEAMAARQDYKCAICRKPQTTTSAKGRKWRLCVDHDHITGEVRGLLCNLCNKGIGCLRDDPEVLDAAVAYLRNAKQKQENNASR